MTTLSDTVILLSGAAAPVPKVMHFVWVGGSEVGNIQRDYMNIWREVLKPQDYKFNLWYDSDALLAFEMNRVILDSARVHAMASGGSDVTQSRLLSQMIEDRARVLKNQMFDYLNQPQWAGRTDEARIELMVRAYGKDRATLEAFRQRCLDTHQAMAGQDLQLRDVKHEFAGHFLQDVYQREVGMRGNFAAASDVVRLQAEYLEGGRYSDMDYLPPLAEKLGGVDISGFSDDQRLGVLQLLLNHNEALMPGRDRQRYVDKTDKIPARDKDALLAFARSQPDVHDLFVAPRDAPVPENGFRMGTQFDREMNAHFVAHAQSGMTLAIMQLIRFNYDALQAVERKAAEAGINWAQSDRLLDVIENVLNEKRAEGRLNQSVNDFLSNLGQAIFGYYQDGIRTEARGTITLTGPGAAITGIRQYIETHLHADSHVAIQERLRLAEGYNVNTEEEMISGWTVNDDPEQWLAKEQEKWQTGKLKSRYAGDLNDLLKGQTLTFKQGWPLIEGRPVLLTSVLQQLIEALGDPFIRAMKDKLSGDITFDKPVAIGFDVRQQILAQSVSELPPSHGAESTSHLNELFTRVVHGSLTVEQLSPLLRVMLGGMFGATRLDTSGFEGAWQRAMDLATQTAEGGLYARYNAIEKALHQHASPAFEAGLANALQPGTHTARELKVLALTDPLTLHQWGERIGQINSTAQREYHTQILTRGAQVRAELFMAGAISARQMPQDLLMRTPGDPGRRCYPLALLMAAALTHGDSAERVLIGRVANASLTPEDADSRALLSALDELQALRLSDVGKPQGTHSLESIAQTLEAKTAPSVMLLDTGNHAMLVAKMRMGSQTVYRFYEPNFAIYGFSRVEELKQGMQRYLAGDSGAMARLYGLADGEAARFNVIELNTAELAGKVLSSNTRLDSFLQSGPIVEAKTASVWEKQAVGRQRSLNENARMGAGLAQLDARYWAHEFDQASSVLRTEHKLGGEYLPLLDTLEQKPDAGYSVTMVDAHNPQNTQVVTTHDVRFSKVKQHIQRLVKTLAGKPAAVSEADGGSRLSFAFAIQTLITEMRNREYQAGEGQVPALSIALQVQVYVSYAQLGFGVLSDSVQLINLVRQVAASEQALALRQSSLSVRLLGKASMLAGIGFSVVNIGFDIYGLAVADNQEQRSRLATQLTFNVAALGLDIVALAVGGTVGAAAAVLSVPLLGVGIGVTAIASNLGQISDKAKGVGAHLRKVRNAYGSAGYTRKNGVLRFEPEAVITLLDLQKNQVSFDSQKFYPMVRGGLGLPEFNDDPRQIHRAIDIREALKLPGRIGLIRVVPDDIQTVVLPCTPICYYGYEYQLGTPGYAYQTMPGERREPRAWSEVPTSVFSGFFPGLALASHFDDRIETRYPDLRNSAVEKLEYDEHGNQRFYFTVNTPFPHILYKLHPIYKPTHIEVRLDEHVRQLLIPELPPEWKKLISYAITAQSGLYQLWLTPGITAVTLDDVSYAKWVIHAPWANLERVTFADSKLIVDDIVLNAFEGMIELAKGELFQVDWQEKRLLLRSVSLEAGRTSAQVLSHIRKRAREKRLVSAYVPLYKYTVPSTSASQPLLTTAYYEVARDRLLYARNLPKAVNDGVVLGGANRQHAWFYHPDHATLWRVDAVTGTVIHRYRLMNPASGARIIGCVQDANSTLRISQRMLEQSEVETTLEYRITGWAIELTGIKTSSLQRDYVHKPGAVYWSSLIHHFATSRPFKDATPGMGGEISTGVLATFVHARAYVLEGLRDQAWLGLSSGRYFRAGLGRQRDMVMLVPHKPQDFAMLFYSKEYGEISRGIEPRTAGAEYRNEVIERGVSEVTRAGEHYIATKNDGRLFEIDPLGTLKFVGLGQRWLQRHPDWLSALPALAATYREAPFPIIGLGGVCGSALLAVWCIEEQVLLADVAGGKELALLGLTPDKQAAWLLDVSAGQLYRQALVSIEALREAFATGTRLLDPEQLPMAKKVWDQWSFAEVLVQGQGLLGRTREGVNLELLDQQPARIVGVEKQWASIAGQTPEQLQARLKTLLKGQSHAPFLHVENSSDRYTYFVPELDQLFDISGRADGHWAVFLGTRNQSKAMLFDPLDSLNSSRESEHALWVPGQYARREGEVLSLEMSGEVTDVLDMLPDGVDKLILGFGAQALSYRVSEQAWQRLDCIVVDPRRPLGAESTSVCTLMLDMDANERLLVSLVDGQLVFTDSDNAHSLIVRDVVAQGEEQGVAMQIGIKIRAKQYLRGTGEWLNALSAARGGEGHSSVETLIKQLH
ncbi:TcdA/TcdB pore-forming domain-containing protein [Pseudomonas sp. FP2196]|uniref:TcdA/TcdB pore-forming domain-containing protein n=1 Tax=Pseudomonas sp. FP2196 TaxID=2954086 RepID=UPI002736DE34|nr:TcdA/TcdB pore-forming domain-containing protein [Pseudomonas sp. FP2196]WLH36291.1 TcdA/TcdB pore-forming domain-containing protein [Pseudomonas sp. FP2196]